MTLNHNNGGEPLINVGMSSAEMRELILLIDDEPVDEVMLAGIRKKLRNRNKRLHRILDGSTQGASVDG